MKAISSDVIGQTATLDELTSSGEHLLSVMEAAGASDSIKSREIRRTLDSMQARFGALRDASITEMQNVNDAFVSSYVLF